FDHLPADIPAVEAAVDLRHGNETGTILAKELTVYASRIAPERRKSSLIGQARNVVDRSSEDLYGRAVVQRRTPHRAVQHDGSTGHTQQCGQMKVVNVIDAIVDSELPSNIANDATVIAIRPVEGVMLENQSITGVCMFGK